MPQDRLQPMLGNRLQHPRLSRQSGGRSHANLLPHGQGYEDDILLPRSPQPALSKMVSRLSARKHFREPDLQGVGGGGNGGAV